MNDQDFVNTDFLPYFLPMLCDENRNSMYEKAIHAAVSHFIQNQHRKPKVLDVGAGTGMLSIFAAQAGAIQVVGLEANKLRAKIAQKNIQQQGFHKQIQIINCKSTEFQCKESFDMVISEILGTSATNEDMNEYLADLLARKVVQKFENNFVYCIPIDVHMWIQAYQFRNKQDQGVSFMRQELLKKNCDQFEISSLLGVYPHERELIAVKEPIKLIDQSSYEPIVLKEISLQVEKELLYICEWRCRLFSDTFLQHTLSAVSEFSPSQYSIRMKNWGFRVYSPVRAKSITISVTKDDILITSSKKKMKF